MKKAKKTTENKKNQQNFVQPKTNSTEKLLSFSYG